MTFEILVVRYDEDNAAQRFTDSLRNTGFALIEDAPIDRELIDETYAKWEEFFNSEYKHDYAFNDKTHDGYISTEKSEIAKGYDQKDLKEFYHYYMNGRCPESLEETTIKLFNEMNAVAEKLLSWVEKCMPEDLRSGLSEPLSKMIHNSPKTLFRLIHYPPLLGDESPGAVRAAAHEDINLLTILPAATAGGLQVMDNNDNWLDVPCTANRIVVNTGDMLQECTNGYFRATKHRVVNPEGELARQSRLSMPLFLHPRDEVVLSARHTAGSFRLERYKELGLASEDDGAA